MNINVAANLEEAEQMKRDGKDPILVRANEHEVWVFTKSEEIADNIWMGMQWSICEGSGPDEAYEKYIFTRLNKEQLIEHLNDPTKFQGED